MPEITARRWGLLTQRTGWPLQLLPRRGCPGEGSLPSLCLPLPHHRVQDQGSARQDEHVHQDTGAWGGAGLYRDRPQRGRGDGQA